MKRLIISGLVVAGAVGCGQMPGGMDAGGPDITCSANPAMIKLSTDLYPVMFGGDCVTCHYPAGYMGMATEGAGGAYGDYTSAAKTALIISKKSVYAGAAGTLKIVDPMHLDNSTLWLKLSSPHATGWPGPHGESTNARMPNDGTNLADGVLQKVKDWICTGAQM
jgi:hypothetical protein